MCGAGQGGEVVQPGRERLPWVAMLVVLGLVGCVLGLVIVGPRRAAQTLGEWLPTSGGTGEQVQLTITTAEGRKLIAAETKIK